MPRRKTFTPAVIARIPRLVDQGLSAEDIADSLRCTIGTLRVRCSQLGISLRRKGLKTRRDSKSPIKPTRLFGAPSRPGPASDPSGSNLALALVFSKRTAERLSQYASRRGLTVPSLAAALLEIIARDSLYEAVLDDDNSDEPKSVRTAKAS